MTNKLQHQEFTAEIFTDEHGQLVTIRQEDYSGNDDNYTVSLHPWQLRAVCEQFGIIASDHQAQRTIATLTRRLLVLNGRIESLASYMTTRTDTRRPDLTYELASINALNDIAAEFVAELDGSQVTTEPPNQPPERTQVRD